MPKQLSPIALELKTVRIILGLTQGKLAELFNKTPPLKVTTTRSDISRYEVDLMDLPTKKYKKFLSLLDE